MQYAALPCPFRHDLGIGANVQERALRCTYINYSELEEPPIEEGCHHYRTEQGAMRLSLLTAKFKAYI